MADEFETEIRNFLQTSTQMSAVESEIISLHESRIKAIRQIRSAFERGDRKQVFERLNQWTNKWNKVQELHKKLTDIAREGALRGNQAPSS